MYKFTLEERKEIALAMDVIAEDLKDFLDSTGSNYLCISYIVVKGLFYKGHNEWKLHIENDGKISLTDYYNDIEYILTGESTPKLDDARFRFIGCYDDIRENVVEYCEKYFGNRNSFLDSMHNIRDKYGKTVDISLELPPSINRYELEVTEEDGKKIGSISFDKKTVRIFTEGNIEVVNGPTKDVPKLTLK